MKRLKFIGLGILALSVGFTSCDKDDEIIEGIQRSELIITKLAGEGLQPHGDHFHGLDKGVEQTPLILKFNRVGELENKKVVELDASTTYKLEYKAWDHNNKEVQKEYLLNKVTADQYKAFLVGGDFILNTKSATGSGAAFQPRELTYGDGTAVTGKYETIGIISYFAFGKDNVSDNKSVRYIVRKLDKDVKSKIERIDWNRNDYKTAFAGGDVAELKFDINISTNK